MSNILKLLEITFNIMYIRLNFKLKKLQIIQFEYSFLYHKLLEVLFMNINDYFAKQFLYFSLNYQMKRKICIHSSINAPLRY